MKEQNKAIDEKALTELRKLVVEREKLDGRIKELLGMNTETRPTKKPLSREQFRMLCGCVMGVQFYSPRNNWCVQWQENGVRRKRYFKTEQEAHAFERERLEQKEGPRQLTLGELVALYFRSNPDKHPKTRKNIVYFFAGHEDRKTGKHIEGTGEFLRDKYAERLDRSDLETMREAFRARGTSNATMNKYQKYIHAILAWGADQELVASNPWRDFKYLKAQRRIISTTLCDFQMILPHCPDWLVWALKTAYALALRPGQVELFSLPWSAFNWRFGYVQLLQGKTGRMKRVIPPPLYWQEARGHYEEDMSAGIPWVCHRAGKRVLDYNQAWRKALADSGMSGRGIRMYDIRHVAASEMLAAGADLPAVSAQLGHASTQTTASTYAHVVPRAQLHAAEVMPVLGMDKKEDDF